MKIATLALLGCLAGPALLAQENHSEYMEGPFSSPQEVTETCLLCHDGIDQDIMKTRHWNWLGDAHATADGTQVRRGKQNVINNYCIGLDSNWPRCTSCHIGYGWSDNSFDFTDGKNIDCLVCHDRSGTYKKTPTGAGLPDPSVDLARAAQSVGPTGNQNCGFCHFDGGGGTGVKHGDLDGSMLQPSAQLDVHMGKLGFTCSDCHAGENHQIRGASHGSLATGTNHISCLDCHDERPHEMRVINNHTASLACETCHIPAFAREEPTKVWWDWSTAGQDKKVPVDEFGKETYDKKKGDFVWAMNVVPAYAWHNGQADYYSLGEPVDPSKPLPLNRLAGSLEDPGSKISPFKVMKGKQIYDAGAKCLVVPKLYGPGGYWQTYDWNGAAKLGMEENGLTYSGSHGFVETTMHWPINHMVAPAEDALKCTACHHTDPARSRMDWEGLGYGSDPMRSGGRLNFDE
ncbi:MAG: tetrathionate reductase family octaheme c-type cytochrome [Bacteroidales bacterium]